MMAILVIAIFSSSIWSDGNMPPVERVQVVHPELAKWDRNGDGKLTGPERDEFIKAKRKESADAENARRAAKLNGKPPRRFPPRPQLNPEAAQTRVPVGVPKNMEEAQR